MACFVVGGQTLLVLGHDERTAFRTHHHLVFCVFEFAHRYNTLATASRQQGCLINEVHQVSTREARRAACHGLKINVWCQRNLAHMHAQNLFATNHIRIRHNNLAVKPTRTQQCGIKHVRTVRRRDQNDAFIGFKPIHLDQQLVERLFALIIAAAKACATMATDGVDFVDKDNARRILLGLLKHVAHTTCTNADKHFDKVRTRDREERHIRLARNRTRQQGLTRAGRSNEQHATRNTSTETLEFLRVAKELDDFFQIFFRLVHTRDIGEGHAAMRFVQ